MKKLLLLISIISFSILRVHAQEKGDVELGIGLGLNLSYLGNNGRRN